MHHHTFFAAVLALSACAAGARTLPGEYITADGWGRLVIDGQADGLSNFVLETTGANRHSCNVEGAIVSGVGRAALPLLPEEERCVIAFISTAAGIQVKAQTFEACRQHCGTRAGLEGEYLAVESACGNVARQQTRNDSLASARAGRHQRAAELLQTLQSRCALTLSPTESADIRNDLAVAYHHLGRQTDCLEALRPVLAATQQSDLDLLRERVPGDYEQWSAISSRAHFNERLCARPGPH